MLLWGALKKFDICDVMPFDNFKFLTARLCVFFCDLYYVYLSHIQLFLSTICHESYSKTRHFFFLFCVDVRMMWCLTVFLLWIFRVEILHFFVSFRPHTSTALLSFETKQEAGFGCFKLLTIFLHPTSLAWNICAAWHRIVSWAINVVLN